MADQIEGTDNVVQLHPGGYDNEQSEQQRRRGGPALNRVELLGRLTGKPDVRFTASGSPITAMRLVTNETEQPEYHSLVAFGKVGEFAAEHLDRGRLVWIEGRLRTREYSQACTDCGKSQRRWRTEILVNRLQVLSPKPAASDQ